MLYIYNHSYNVQSGALAIQRYIGNGVDNVVIKSVSGIHNSTACRTHIQETEHFVIKMVRDGESSSTFYYSQNLFIPVSLCSREMIYQNSKWKRRFSFCLKMFWMPFYRVRTSAASCSLDRTRWYLHPSPLRSFQRYPILQFYEKMAFYDEEKFWGVPLMWRTCFLIIDNWLSGCITLQILLQILEMKK